MGAQVQFLGKSDKFLSFWNHFQYVHPNQKEVFILRFTAYLDQALKLTVWLNISPASSGFCQIWNKYKLLLSQCQGINVADLRSHPGSRYGLGFGSSLNYLSSTYLSTSLGSLEHCSCRIFVVISDWDWYTDQILLLISLWLTVYVAFVCSI